eukprot:m.452163 g.452163  ORF g.452163 m.452163 type:complete len:237 (+) comp56925_c0_seq12:185-895(+)
MQKSSNCPAILNRPRSSGVWWTSTKTSISPKWSFSSAQHMSSSRPLRFPDRYSSRFWLAPCLICRSPYSLFARSVPDFLLPRAAAARLEQLLTTSVCLQCAALGAYNCFLLSYFFGRTLLQHYFPERCAQWQTQLANHKDHLVYYVVFLRITPFLPNWFINLAAPVVGVPAVPFFVGTFLGVAPPSFIYAKSGTVLQELTSTRDAFPYSAVLWLILFGLLSLIPVLFKKRLASKLE